MGWVLEVCGIGMGWVLWLTSNLNLSCIELEVGLGFDNNKAFHLFKKVNDLIRYQSQLVTSKMICCIQLVSPAPIVYPYFPF